MVEKDDLLTVENLETALLKNISFKVKKGAVFGIIGESGAGKTTLMRALVGLEKSTGRIYFQEKKFGMIFQHFNLFSSRTALENVAFPLEIAGYAADEAERRARELLQLVGLEKRADGYPAKLSGGEKQRVAIARALALQPSILFSDESTSALDPTTKKNILSLLLKLNRELGLTIILITHEMGVIKEICTDVLVIEKGKIVEQGKVEELFLHPQHSMTRKFLETLSHDDIPAHLLNYDREKQQLLRLHFKGKSAEEPIITQVIRKFQVDVNILLGGIDTLRSSTVGTLLIALTGPFEERLKACRFLEEQGVLYERIDEYRL